MQDRSAASHSSPVGSAVASLHWVLDASKVNQKKSHTAVKAGHHKTTLCFWKGTRFKRFLNFSDTCLKLRD